jgi:hypothetical protein
MKHALFMMPAVFALALGLQLPLTDTAEARMCRNPNTGALRPCNPKPYTPRAKDLSAYNPTFKTTKTGRQTATATITFVREGDKWRPIHPTGKRTPRWRDDYLRKFNPQISPDGQYATATIKFKQGKRGWAPIVPRQPRNTLPPP